MTRNVGRIDQFVRMVLGLAIFAYAFKDGTLNSMWPVYIPIALILIATAFFSFCPLYTLLGWSTANNSRRVS
jgi:hypothetical protein